MKDDKLQQASLSTIVFAGLFIIYVVFSLLIFTEAVVQKMKHGQEFVCTPHKVAQIVFFAEPLGCYAGSILSIQF